MARKLVTKLSNRECFTLIEKDTLKTASNKLQTHTQLSYLKFSFMSLLYSRDIHKSIYCSTTADPWEI